MGKYNWKEIEGKIRDAIRMYECEPTVRAVSRHFGIPRTTIRNAIKYRQLDKSAFDDVNELGPHSRTVSVIATTHEEAKEKLLSMGYTLDEWTVKSVNIGEFKEHTSFRFVLIPIESELTKPYLRPVRIDGSIIFEEKEIKKKSPKKTLIIPDLHVPFTDMDAFEAAHKLVVDGDFDKIVLLGDLLDLPEWTTRFTVDPKVLQRTQSDIQQLSQMLLALRCAAGDEAEIIALEGNHDLRFGTMMKNNLPQGFSLKTIKGTSIASLRTYVDFDSMGVEYIEGYPEADYRIDDFTVATHGNKVGGPGATAPKMHRPEDNIVCGHSHRTELVYFKQNRWVLNSGFMGTNNGELPGSRKRNDWTVAVGIIESYPDHSVPRVLMFDGKEYK